MSTIIDARKYRHMLQSALCLLDEAHALIADSLSDGQRYPIEVDDLVSLHQTAQRLTDQISTLAEPEVLDDDASSGPAGEANSERDFDRQPTPTPPVKNSDLPPSPLTGEGRGEGAPSNSSAPRLSLSSASVSSPDTTPPVRTGNGACGCSPRRS